MFVLYSRWKGENVSTAEVEAICSSVLDLKVSNAHLNGKMRIRMIYFYAGLPIRMPFILGENAHQDAI